MARFNFRQGIARRQQDGLGNPNNLQPSNGGSWIDLIVSPDPTVFIIAHYDTDYMFTENTTIAKAWGPFTAGTDYWLYWDIDFRTGELSRGYTLEEPVFGNTPPSAPVPNDTHWFDTNEMVMKTPFGPFGNRWVERIRVFAAKYQGGATIIDYPLGTQVGVSGFNVHAGKVLYDPDGKPLQVFQRNRRGQFITTETPLHSQFSRIANFRVEAAIVQGEAVEPIAIHHAVAFNDFDELMLARNTDTLHPAIGLATEDMVTGEIRSYITKGFIRDEVNWDWSAFPVHTALFVGPTGNLLTEPEAGALTQQQVGYTVNANTIFVDVGQQILLEPPVGNEIVYHLNRDTGALIARQIQLNLDDLIDVNAWNPQDGDVIVWDDLQNTWVLKSGCCEGQGAQELNDLNDVIVMPDEGDHLVFRGSWWVSEPAQTGSLAYGLFVTDVTSPGGGIIGDYVYAPSTIPSNVVVTEATSDQAIVRVHFVVEGDGSYYSPTVTVDVGVGDHPGIMTEDSEDIRTFHGYADVTIADGLFAGRPVLLEASHGQTATVLIKRAADPAEIQSMIFDNIYPVVPADPPSGYAGGTQTKIKAGDDFYVVGTVDNSATLVELLNGGAVGAGTYTTSTAGSSLGAPDSGGPGLKNFTIRFTASSAIGMQQATARAQNSFGSYGSNYMTTNLVLMDQDAPSVSISGVDYPPGQMALKGSEIATVNNTVSDFDYVYYYENGAAGAISITNPITYETAKTVTRTGGNYLYDADNFAIQAFKTANGTSTTVTNDVNISNIAPTVDITGASTRLISSPGGEDYVITLTFSQQLLGPPTIQSSGDFDAGDRGGWSGAGDTWSFTLTIDDADTKGVYSWTVDNVNTLSNNTYNGVTINSGSTYEIGGFTIRNVTVGALEQVVDLGVDLTDPSKVNVRYAGTADLLTYRGSDLSQFQKGWSAVDGTQLIYTPGPEPFPNYSNYVFQDPTVTPTSWLFLTDAFFAGANTTGTLLLEIEETA